MLTASARANRVCQPLRQYGVAVPLPERRAPSMHCYEARMPGRERVESMVRRVFRQSYGACVSEFYPRLLAFEDGTVMHAVVGLRTADDDERFFSERYLDTPIEQRLRDLTGTCVARAGIAEIGNLAFASTGQARWLIAAITAYLYAADYRWVLFTAVTPLYNAFRRLGLAPLHVAPADPARLADGGRSWGSYYSLNPQVWAGDVRAGFRALHSDMPYNHSVLQQLWQTAMIEGARERRCVCCTRVGSSNG